MTQKDTILQLLEDRGELGVLNIELNEIAFRYSARLREIRKDGYRIRTTHIKNATWRFTLLSDDAKPLEVAAEMDTFNEQLRTYVSACCGEPINLFGFCGFCREHI